MAVVLAAAGCGRTSLLTGAGGSPGVGAVSGFDGSPGTGGVPCITTDGCIQGTGGVAGIDGGAGAGGTSVALCQQLLREYVAVVLAAGACTVGAPDQCQALASSDPRNCSACTGLTYVNDGTIVLPARQKWLAACDTADLTCQVNGGCPSPPPGTCVPTKLGWSIGQCLPSVPDGGVAPPIDTGESCDQVADDYAAVVSAARACAPGFPGQCQTYAFSEVPVGVCCAGVAVPVNDHIAVNAAADRWFGTPCATLCAGGCFVAQPPAACVPVDGGPTPGGICM